MSMIRVFFSKLKIKELSETSLKIISNKENKVPHISNFKISEEEILSKDFRSIGDIKQKLIELSNLNKSEPIILKMPSYSLNCDFIVGKKYKHDDPNALFECIIYRQTPKGKEEIFRMVGKEANSVFLNEYLKLQRLPEGIFTISNIIYDDYSLKFNAIYSTPELNSELLKINKILKKDPTDNNAILYKGWILSELGRFTDAITCYDTILKVQPDSNRALKDRNLVESKKNDEGQP